MIVNPLIDIAQLNDDIMVQIHADVMSDKQINEAVNNLVQAIKTKLDADNQKAFSKLLQGQEL